MLARSDRREWAVLGLVALGWALLVAPVLHRQVHLHGDTHSHGAPADSSRHHGDGSLEHQAALFDAPSPTPLLVAQLTPVEGAVLQATRTPWLESRRTVEQSQAP